VEHAWHVEHREVMQMVRVFSHGGDDRHRHDRDACARAEVDELAGIDHMFEHLERDRNFIFGKVQPLDRITHVSIHELAESAVSWHEPLGDIYARMMAGVEEPGTVSGTAPEVENRSALAPAGREAVTKLMAGPL